MLEHPHLVRAISSNRFAASLFVQLPTFRADYSDWLLSLFSNVLRNSLQYYIFFLMKRNSIRKASSFKLQAARARFHHYLEDIDGCPAARKWPNHLDNIRSSSETAFEMCYSFREDSPFLRALNYDNRYYGFSSVDNCMTYRDYLGPVKQAFLFGDFNGFDKGRHALQEDEEMGNGWFKLSFDLNEFRLEEGSKLMVRVINQQGQEWCFPPPSCYFVDQSQGIFRKYAAKSESKFRHKISHLLAYTIDLSVIDLKDCLAFIEAEMEVLECFNTVILKNLFGEENGFLHKFSLSAQKAELLEIIVEKLSRSNIKVVIEWNFDEGDLTDPLNPLEEAYFKETGSTEYQFDLSKEAVLAYYLASIAHYIKFYGVGGIHLTKVHKICQKNNGTLLVKLINLLCERLREDTITLASSKEFIPGLTWPILQGGLGFSFTYNFHETLSLNQQHQSIYEMVKQIQSSSNCLSLHFDSVQPSDYIYLLFTFLISKRGVFTRGPIEALRQDLKKVLKLRRQEELFHEECEMQRIDEDCMVVSRGSNHIIFNFSKQKTLQIDMPAKMEHNKVIFNETEEQIKLTGLKLVIGPLNCLMFEQQ